MDIRDYIDWDEGRDFEDASFSVAVNICEGCNHTCDRLTEEPVEGLQFCDDCMEETMQVLAREVCEHLKVRFEEHEDPNDECVRVFEEITCCDCGEELVERKGELVARKRRAA